MTMPIFHFEWPALRPLNSANVVGTITKPLATTLFYALPLIASAQATFAFTNDEAKYLAALIQFQQMAELPLAAKQYLVARAHERDGDLGDDDKRAEDLYIRAANGGHAAAQEYLAEAFRKRRLGAKIDARQVARWETAATQDNAASRVSWAARAEKSDGDAQYALSLTLADEDRPRAIALLKASAESGYIPAQLNLAYKYRRGLGGFERSASDSKAWYLKAAAQIRPMAEEGNPLAMRALADLSMQGKGVPYDPELATVLFQIEHRILPSSEFDSREMDKIQAELSDERLARAKTVAAKWQPGQPLPRDMRQAICTASDFNQPHFDRQHAQVEFADFQARLRQGIDAVSDLEYSQGNESAVLDGVHQAFQSSIAPGPKGEALLAEIARPSPGGVVSPMGTMLDKLMSKACPVGFGGRFTDDGHAVELWYVDLDPEDRGALEAFTPAELPPNGSMLRGKFPALVFARSEDGRLKLYGMSQEMAKVLKYWWGIQLQ